MLICHHKSVLNLILNQELLKRTGLDFQVSIPAAAAWPVLLVLRRRNMTCQSRSRTCLAAAVRSAAADTLIITDGFSCYQQIEGLTDAKPCTSQSFQMAIRESRRRREDTAGRAAYAEAHK